MSRNKTVEQEGLKTNMRKLVIKKSISPRRELDDDDLVPLTLPRMSWAEMLLIAGTGENRQRLLSKEHTIDEWRDAVMEVAGHVLKENVALMVHVPDDYDERDKFIRTGAFALHDALYSGECKDFVKSAADSEWYICAAEGVRVPVRELTDRDSMRGALESLLEVLENIPCTRTLGFREWRSGMGI